MDYEFLLPGRAPFLVQGWGNFQIELIGALAGIKPATQVWVQEGDLDYVRKLCATLGLNFIVYSRQESAQGPARLGVMVGAEKEALLRAARMWEGDKANPGMALGYPECCALFYWEHNYEEADPAKNRDVLFHIFANTPKAGKSLPFLLNNAFYLFSRPQKEGDQARREEVYRKNMGLNLNVMNLLPWHPCSYRCRPSLARAAAVWSLMHRLVPALPPLLKSCLARPVLFWDWDRFAVLKGAAKAGGIAYTGVQPPFSRLDPATSALLSAGDNVRRLGSGDLEVRKGTKRVALFPADKTLLLDFVA